MSFLLENNSENISARITNKGRQKIAQGNFNISYFQIGDSEFDYEFSELDGLVDPITGLYYRAQKVLMPFDKDNQVKYPYKVSESTLTGTTYGTPIQSSYSQSIKNEMMPAGFVSGVTIHSLYDVIDISELDGTTSIDLPSGDLLSGLTTDDYITIALSSLDTDVITGASMSFVYRITGITSNTLYLDRSTPDLSGYSTPFNVTVIKNGYYPYNQDHCFQHDSWTLNTVWSEMPAGLEPTVDEHLSGYTSNVFVSTKEYLGYNTSTGQTYNTGTTITNSSGDVIIVPPEEQHSLSILRYPRDIDIYNVHDLGFKYEDYIDSSTSGEDYFEVSIPFIYYDRNTTSTIGAKFYMSGTTDYYINSYATDTKVDQMKYRRLIDEQGNNVGKIFVNQKLIVFDDQEIVAALDYKSNRRYTLPIPRISTVPVDSKCDVLGDINDPLLYLGQTVFVTYLLAYTGGTGLTGMHCNHYGKVVGGAVDSDVTLTFGANDFQFMTTGTTSTTGYAADKFYILVQRVPTGTQPVSDEWYIIDYTDDLVTGGTINPDDLRNTRFIISSSDIASPTFYDLETYLGDFPDEPSGTSIPEFGDEQPFPGQIDVVRGYDIQVMNYLINLPSGYFETSQNPYFVNDPTSTTPKRITEVALLDSNKEVLVMAKTSSPIKREGTQVVAVKIDL